MTIVKDEFHIDKKSLAKIENLLPRLKHSVLPSKIVRWLENFNTDEIDLAIDLLSVFEYVSFNEFMLRLDILLSEILKNIPKDEKIIIYPYGNVGKSGTLVTYPLRNTKAYKTKQFDILITHDIKNINNLSEFKHIIFIDDFIGSGNTFTTEYKNVQRVENWVKNNQFKKLYLLAPIIMNDGKLKIEDNFSEIKIHAEIRNKIFDSKKSPLSIFKNFDMLQEMSLRNGKKLTYSTPYGFDNGQSLISFFHGTPDNTLPIIWVENNNWNAIYPREPKIRMDEAKEFKKEVAYYIGICNKIGIDIITGKNIIEKINDKYVRKATSNSKQAHSIVALLFLKKSGYDNLIICHLLGLTREELRKIYLEAKMKNLIDINYNLSNQGYQFLEDLKIRTKKEKIRKETKENLSKRKNIIYIPNMFKGMT